MEEVKVLTETEVNDKLSALKVRLQTVQTSLQKLIKHDLVLAGVLLALCEPWSFDEGTVPYGRPKGDPKPYFYFTEDGDTIKECYIGEDD